MYYAIDLIDRELTVEKDPVSNLILSCSNQHTCLSCRILCIVGIAYLNRWQNLFDINFYYPTALSTVDSTNNAQNKNKIISCDIVWLLGQLVILYCTCKKTCLTGWLPSCLVVITVQMGWKPYHEDTIESFVIERDADKMLYCHLLLFHSVYWCRNYNIHCIGLVSNTTH